MLMNVRWHSLVVQMLTVSTHLALSLVPAMRDSEEMVSIVQVSTSALSRPTYLGLLELHEGILTHTLFLQILMNVWSSLLVIRAPCAPTQMGPSLAPAMMDTGEME